MLGLVTKVLQSEQRVEEIPDARDMLSMLMLSVQGSVEAQCPFPKGH
jgi:hypothetical protein